MLYDYTRNIDYNGVINYDFIIDLLRPLTLKAGPLNQEISPQHNSIFVHMLNSESPKKISDSMLE